MNPQQRNQLASQMEQILTQLTQENRPLLLRDLPPTLQQQIRALPMIGPITSGGLERAFQLFNRIDFAVFGLREIGLFDVVDNHFVRRPVNLSQAPTETDPAESPDKELPIAAPASVERVEPTPPPTAPTSSGFDFGPFDPRKQQK